MKIRITYEFTVLDGDDLSSLLDGANAALDSVAANVENESGFSLDYNEDDAACVEEVKA